MMVYDHSFTVFVKGKDFTSELIVHTKSDYVCEVGKGLSIYNGMKWVYVKPLLLYQGYKLKIMQSESQLLPPPSPPILTDVVNAPRPNRLDIGFTGTRLGLTQKQKETVEYLLRCLANKYISYWQYFRHGDCVGADAEAHQIALNLDYRILIHPPIKSVDRAYCSDYFSLLPKDDYLKRNRCIVDKSAMVIAAPKDNNQEGGTWYTINYARKVRVPLRIVYADGSFDKGLE
jgi:hypothetical protein